MKKKIILPLTIALSQCALFSCAEKNEYLVYSMMTEEIKKDEGKIRVIDSEESVSVFNTFITGNIYYRLGDYTNAEIRKIEDRFIEEYQYYHALFDRHYDYEISDGSSYKKVNNIKVLNESYGSEKEILLDPFLYQSLKDSVEFAVRSSSLFNPFLGQINDIYENRIPFAKTPHTSLEGAMVKMTDLYFSSFTQRQREEIEEAVQQLPTSEEELRKVLTFNDKNYGVTFHKFIKDGKENEKLQISLGGNGKGMATEKITSELMEDYPDLSLFINSGSSSLKASLDRIDRKGWLIRYQNPLFAEINNTLNKDAFDPYLPYEVQCEIQGSFNLSTSAYYEQYFYSLEEDGVFKLNSHLIDPNTGYSKGYFDQVSVLIKDTGLADMYTTALMNTGSEEEAIELFDKLNAYYKQEDAGLLLCYKVEEVSEEKYAHSMSDYSPLSKYNLPIVNLQSGVRYEGDYSDVQTYQQIGKVISERKRDCREMYRYTEGFKDKISLLELSQEELKKRKAILKEI